MNENTVTHMSRSLIIYLPNLSGGGAERMQIGLCNFLLLILLSSSCLLFSSQAKAAQAAAAYCARPSLGLNPLKDRPVFSVKYYGAKGDGKTDDTQALQKAFDEAPSGSVLTFPSGVYLHSKSLILSKEGTILKGEGGVLQATNPDDQSIVLKGNKSAIVGLSLKGVGAIRSSMPQTTKIRVLGRWNQIVGNTIDGGASAGIFVYGGQDFWIVGNVVHDTLADGIHMTNGSRRGLVEGNRVYHTGDDMIAVVSYGNKTRPFVEGNNLSGDILVRNNSVESNTNGRGLTVVGGENVALLHNEVSQINCCAGILVAQETAYHTEGVRNILIQGNIVKGIQLRPPASGARYTHQAAIDINTSQERPVESISVRDNVIDEARFSGLRILRTACNIDLFDNQINHTQGGSHEPPINVLHSDCAPKAIHCAGNKVDGKAYVPDSSLCADDKTSVSGVTPDLGFIHRLVWLGCNQETGE